MRNHLSPGGVLVVDGWVRRRVVAGPRNRSGVVQQQGRVGAATSRGSRRDGVSTTLELHHLVGSIDGVEHLVETHDMTLFSDDEYREASDRAGLIVDITVSPHPDRDRYIGYDPP